MSPPRPRSSRTFEHSDIFGSRQPESVKARMNPTNQSGVGKSSYKTPKRVRENDTTRSFVLDKSDMKKELPGKPFGKKTYRVQSSIFKEQPNKQYHPNPHRIPDHKGEWFFDQTTEPRRNLSVSKLASSPKKDFIKAHNPPSHKKQEELYHTEIGRVALNPNGNNLNIHPRAKSQFELTADLDRSYSPERSNRQRRLMHNESNIFNKEDYESKVQNQKAYTENNEEVETQPSPKRAEPAFDNVEVERIKRLNHNFSDVFGLEYGSREPVQTSKQAHRELSGNIYWTNVDSMLNEKDLGSRYKEKSRGQPRSRITDQQSQMDTHDGYSKPIQKQPTIAKHQPRILRQKIELKKK